MTILNTEIVSVGQVPVKPYQGKFGDTWFIEGNFSDGSFFSRGAKSVDNAEKLHRQLSELVGQKMSFVVEDSGREYQGNKKWNLKEVPGQQPWQGGQGGRSSYSSGGGSPQKSGSSPASSSYRYTEQGTREERDSIVRQVALKCAVEIGSGREDVLKVADTFYAWLVKGPAAQPEPAPYERYSNEIQQAVRLKDAARLDALTQMIKASLAKGSLNIDQVSALDDELIDAKKAVNSAIAQDQWTKQKQEKARQTEPLHPNAAIADTLNQAQDAF